MSNVGERARRLQLVVFDGRREGREVARAQIEHAQRDGAEAGDDEARA